MVRPVGEVELAEKEVFFEEVLEASLLFVIVHMVAEAAHDLEVVVSAPVRFEGPALKRLVNPLVDGLKALQDIAPSSAVEVGHLVLKADDCDLFAFLSRVI